MFVQNAEQILYDIIHIVQLYSIVKRFIEIFVVARLML
jgi:hypothetical protein